MSVHRSKQPKYTPRGTSTLRGSLSPQGQALADQKASSEQATLALFKADLVPGVDVSFHSESRGTVRGTFKSIERGPRVLLVDASCGLPLSCCPSEVQSIEGSSYRRGR